MTECPLCQQQNECGVTKGEATCWCMTTPISIEALSRIPEEAKNKVCICQACAEKYAEKKPTQW